LPGSVSAMPAASDRIPCCVPFCRRTAARRDFPFAGEILCGKHYRLASKVLRRRRSRLKRIGKRALDASTWARIDRLDAILWRQIKSQAIERAFGVA